MADEIKIKKHELQVIEKQLIVKTHSYFKKEKEENRADSEVEEEEVFCGLE